MRCPALEFAGRWVELGLSVEMEISGRALAKWYYVGPGSLWWSNVLNLVLPPQRLRPDTWPEHQDPVSHTAQKKREGKKRKKKTLSGGPRPVPMPLGPAPSAVSARAIAEAAAAHFQFLDCFFKSSFRIIVKLSGRYRDFPYVPCPHTWIVFPIINISHQSGTFGTIDELTLTHHYPLESIVYTRLYSWCCIFYGFGQMYNDKYLP